MAAHTSQQLIIRADASPQIGTGHVMRCLALAQAWRDAGGQVTCVASALPQALTERLGSEGFTVVTLRASPGGHDDALQTADLARAVGAAWVVVDGYHFDGGYQQALQDAGLRVLFVDDYGHAEAYPADIVLNQNCYAHAGLYQDRGSGTRLLLGGRYTLLRREFQSWQGWRRELPGLARRLLVTMGGADPVNFTSQVLRSIALLAAPELEVTVVVGGGSPHYATLEATNRALLRPATLVRNAADMPGLMAAADLAISAAGSTCYELAFMGLPALFVVLADNQAPLAAQLHQDGTGWNLGWHGAIDAPALADALGRLLGDPEARAAMSVHGRALIDGRGSARVAAELRGELLSLRRVVAEDCRLLWEWANEPAVRAASFSSAPIPWDNHVAWFSARTRDLEHPIFIGVEAGGLPVGQVRFDLEGEVAVISVSLDRRARGLGYGGLLIGLGAAAVFAETRVSRIDAYVKPENQASLRAFERAGFNDVGTATVRGCPALRLTRYREAKSYE